MDRRRFDSAFAISLMFHSKITEDAAELAESIQAVLSTECDLSSVHEHVDNKCALDQRLWTQATELGWLGVGLPQAVGGLGLAAAGLMTLFRQLGRALAPGGFLETLCAAQALAQVPDPKIRQIIDDLMTGKVKIAVPADSFAAMRMSVDTLNQASILLLGDAGSDFTLLPVITDAEQRSLALIHMDGTRAKIEADESWDRTRKVGFLRVLDIPQSILIKDPDGYLWTTFEAVMLACLTADSVGGMETILARTVDYLKQRQQFGRPIGTFQALKHRVADLQSTMVGSGHLLLQAVAPAANPADSRFWAELAKTAATDAYAVVAEEAVQLHGGIGFTWEFDCHLFVKRARLNQALGGANSMLRDRAAAHLFHASRADRTLTELSVDD